MSVAEDVSLGSVRGRLEALGQEHLLAFFDELDAQQQAALLAQIASIDLESMPELIETYVTNPQSHALASDLEPAPYYALRETGPGSWDPAEFRAAGEQLLREGKIAAFTVAGGQGTRLGFDGPKGTYPGSAVRKRPLFACLAEWITAAQSRFGATIPWYVMTSPINHADTVAFFESNRHFGLGEENVMFFSQGVLPSIGMATGKLLLANKHEVAANPDGHGGSLKALHASGAIADMRSRGVEHISYVQIDNPLAKVIDPVFLGLHASAPDSSGQMSSKMVAKTEPSEKVGVFTRSAGKTTVVEYSDLPAKLAEARRADGGLQFNAGSIAIHAIGVGFVETLNAGGRFALPLHRAEKKVPHIDLGTGERVTPDSPNAVKLEAFVFDALPLCENSIVLETDRIEEFAPIKNAEGTDSPATSSRIQTERAARWLELAGVDVPRDLQGECECVLEISPLTAMTPEELRERELPGEIERGAEVSV